MPVEIFNKTYTSIIKVIDVGEYNIDLNNLILNPSENYILNVGIKRIIWSTNGNITISTNNNPLILFDQGSMLFAEMDYILYDKFNQNINISITSGGTIFLELEKDVQSIYDLLLGIDSSLYFSDGQQCVVYSPDIFSDGQPFGNI